MALTIIRYSLKLIDFQCDFYYIVNMIYGWKSWCFLKYCLEFNGYWNGMNINIWYWDTFSFSHMVKLLVKYFFLSLHLFNTNYEYAKSFILCMKSLGVFFAFLLLLLVITGWHTIETNLRTFWTTLRQKMS